MDRRGRCQNLGIGVEVDDGNVSLGSRPDVDDLAAVLELPLLWNMKMSAEMNARGDCLERVQEASLAAVAARRGEIRQTYRAAVREQDVDGSVVRDCGSPPSNIGIGHIAGKPVRFCPDSADARQPQPMKIPDLVLTEQHGRAVSILQACQELQRIVVAERRENRTKIEKCPQIALADLVGIAPVATTEKQIRPQLVSSFQRQP